MVYVLIAILLLIGIYSVISQTIQRKGKLGINFKSLYGPIKCPGCQTPFSKVRIPADFREALWGGFTCSKCGKKFDKWGKKL